MNKTESRERIEELEEAIGNVVEELESLRDDLLDVVGDEDEDEEPEGD